MIVQSDNEREGLRESGRILVAVLRDVRDAVRSGIATKELDSIAEERLRELGGRPAFKGYAGFPAALCVSVNDEIVHGVPDDYALSDGDVVGLDFGVEYDGFYTDSAVTVVVGGAPPQEVQLLLETTQEALRRGIAVAVPGKTTGDIGHAIQEIIEEQGFGLVRELIGHGVGGGVHEDPQVPNFGQPGEGVELQEGLVLAIEPMATLGRGDIERGENGQVYQSRDRSIAAHFEHTVIVGDPPEIITE